MNKDTIWVGLIPGLILPVIVGVSYYFYTFGFDSSENYLTMFMREEMLSPLLAIGCFFNLVLFFVLLRRHKDRSAQGVILSTIFYGVWIVIMKMF